MEPVDVMMCFDYTNRPKYIHCIWMGMKDTPFFNSWPEDLVSPDSVQAILMNSVHWTVGG